MNWTTELPFVLDGIEGGLKIVYTSMGQKFYQNGQEIKRSGSGFGGQKYEVKTTDGGRDIVTVKSNLKNGRQIVFKGEIINLEQPISTLVLILSFLPFVFIAFVIGIFTKGGFGAIDGALLGVCGVVGMLMICNVLREEKNIVRQLIYSLVISIAATAIFLVLALIVGFILGIILGTAFTVF
jgi:hypothetical protein